MKFRKAMEWIRLHAYARKDSPTTFGKSEEWIIRAGELCKEKITFGDGRDEKGIIKRDLRNGGVTDEDVRKSLGWEKIPDDIDL